MDGISIVIISRGREKLLEELLISVKKAQGKTDYPTEIVLVDSSLGTAIEKVKEISQKYNTKYFYKDISVSAKRNYGAENASYDMILFLDSDCIVTDNIFNKYIEVMKKHPDAAGSCGPLEFVGDDNWIWSVIEKTPYTLFFSTAKWGENFVWAPTANFLVKKEVFLKVGGFDETFQKNPGGEDVDLGLRICKAGYKMYSSPESLVYHSKETWSSFKAMFRRVFNYGRGDFSLVERHGDMICDGIPRRFLMIVYGMLLYLLLGILVSPWLLFGIILTPVFEVILTSFLVNKKIKYKSTTFLRQIFVQLFFLWNEVGYLKGCIECKKLGLKNKQIIHFKAQLDSNCYQNYLSIIVYGIYEAITLELLFCLIN